MKIEILKTKSGNRLISLMLWIFLFSINIVNVASNQVAFILSQRLKTVLKSKTGKNKKREIIPDFALLVL
jgi:hypothetical protein